MLAVHSGFDNLVTFMVIVIYIDAIGNVLLKADTNCQGLQVVSDLQMKIKAEELKAEWISANEDYGSLIFRPEN